MDSQIRQYMNQLEPAIREKLTIIERIIRQICPGIQCSMKYKMPTYECDENWSALASQKYHTLFTAKELI